MKPRRPLWRVFATPFVVGVVSIAGLIWALLVDGPLDIAAGLAAGCAIVVLGWNMLRHR